MSLEVKNKMVRILQIRYPDFDLNDLDEYLKKNKEVRNGKTINN